MSEDSIEFQPIPRENTEDGQTRHVYRVSVSLADDIRVNFGHNQYVVNNLSVKGVAVNVSSCLELESGQIIDDIGLKIGDLNITGLSAKVIHCSVHDSGSFQFGLQWVNLAADNRKTLDQTLDQLKVTALQVKDLFEDPPES
nr:PilZ domain-containing protein [uncultured Desulfobacter sp.]